MKKTVLSATLALATITTHAQITGTTWISTSNNSQTVLITADSLRMNKPFWATGHLGADPAVWMPYQRWTDQLAELPGRPNLSAFIPAFNGHYTFTLLASDTLLRHDTYNNAYYLYYRKKATE